MRRFFALLAAVVSLGLTAHAAPRPLTLKDVSLMLRSGYSSADVLRTRSRDLSGRRRDGGTRTRANPRRLRKPGDATAALKEQRSCAAASAVPGAAGGSIMSALKDKLVICRDGSIGPADHVAEENKKLIAFYFSAHWCAPCRKFTPQLVAYYNRVAPQHPEFEVVFVSFDRSRFNWEAYLRDFRMPWPAIDYDQLSGFGGLKQLGGESIPSLVLVDATGHLIATATKAANTSARRASSPRSTESSRATPRRQSKAPEARIAARRQISAG